MSLYHYRRCCCVTPLVRAITLRRRRPRHGRFITTTTNTSTSTTTTTTTTTTESEKTTNDETIHNSTFVAQVHPGPAIIRTTHSFRSRPQPNLLYLPGLRSLPFWTQSSQSQQQQQAGKEMILINRVAYGDPTITAIVEHFDAHYPTICHEYQTHPHDTDTTTTTTNTTTTSSSSSKTTYVHNDETTSNNNNSSNSNEHAMHLLNPGGKWDWHSFMTRGIVAAPTTASSSFRDHFPQTSRILDALRHDDDDDDDDHHHHHHHHHHHADHTSADHNNDKNNNNNTNNSSNNTATATTNPLLRNQLLEHVPFGYVFFSTLHESTQILPHTSPINFRLRIHVPIMVPPATTSPTDLARHCGIRVGTTIRAYRTGQALVLDDSFEHEVWNHQEREKRVVLLVDIWHPDVTMDERAEIRAMFQTAKDQGWLSQ